MKTFLFIALGFCIATGAIADVKIVQKVKNGPMMGQPAKEMMITMYVKGKKARVEAAMGGNTYQIIDLDEGKVYIVYPDKKMAMVMTPAMLKQTASMMGQLTGGQQSKPEVKKLGTTHTYNGYKCEDVQVTLTGPIGITSVACINNSIDVKEFEPFKEFTQDFSSAFGVDPSAGMAGFPVHSDTKMDMMGQKIDSSSDIVSINHDALDSVQFTVPPDYKIQEMKMPAAKKP